MQSVNITWFVAMPTDESLESAIGKAGELEKNYDWLEAAEFYRKAMDLASA